MRKLATSGVLLCTTAGFSIWQYMSSQVSLQKQPINMVYYIVLKILTIYIDNRIFGLQVNSRRQLSRSYLIHRLLINNQFIKI